MKPVIKAENLGKMYILRHEGTFPYYDTIKDTLHARARELGQRILLRPERRPTREEFWALKDIHFEVNKGDRIGIIGHNGAGKSTLLKILSRIIEPTTGTATIRGRVSSLLEVGTGFHPELTGRENIFMNGTILGMSRGEIVRKFDEIVAFAELEKFIDLSVKFYSSGMYLRLAFAVAAHLESELLLVDEVLAVGDVNFQKRCLELMNRLALAGRTVVFVSHNMNAIQNLCTKVILLNQGRIDTISQDVGGTINTYIYGNRSVAQTSSWANPGSLYQHPEFSPTEIFLGDETGKPLIMPVSNNEDIWVYVRGKIQHPAPDLQVGYALFSENNTTLFWTISTDTAESVWPKLEAGTITLRSRIPAHTLNEGKYRLELMAALYFKKWLIHPGEQNAPQIGFSIRGGLSDSCYWTKKRPGILAPMIPWERKDQPGK